MKELKEEILQAVQDATDLTDNIVSIPILSHFLDGILKEQLPIHGVVKSFTAEEVVNELKENETLDDAISFFNSLK